MYSDDICISMLQTKIPLGRGHLDPETFILINLVNAHWTMLLHTKFQASEAVGSDLKIFEYFSMYFCGSLEEALYQISKAWAFWFQTRRF